MFCICCKKEFDPEEESDIYDEDPLIKHYGLQGSYQPFYELCSTCAIDDNLAGYETYLSYAEFLANDD